MTCINNISKPIKCNNKALNQTWEHVYFNPKTKHVFDKDNNYIGQGEFKDNVFTIKTS